VSGRPTSSIIVFVFCESYLVDSDGRAVSYSAFVTAIIIDVVPLGPHVQRRVIGPL
jgi:hypothetical protein